GWSSMGVSGSQVAQLLERGAAQRPQRGGAGEDDGADRQRQQAGEIRAGNGDGVRGRVEDAGEDLDEHLRQRCRGERAEQEAAGGDVGGLRPDEGAQLTRAGAEGGGDGERPAALVEAERERKSSRGGGEDQGESELDLREAGELDGGEVGADDSPLVVDVGDMGAGADDAADPLRDLPGARAARLDEEGADGAAAGPPR